MKLLKRVRAVILTLHMFLKAAQQSQLFNYLHSNINFRRNERLYVVTAQQEMHTAMLQ